MEYRRPLPSAQHTHRFACAAFVVAATLIGSARAEDRDCPRTRETLHSLITGLRKVPSELRDHDPIEVLAIGSSSTEGVGASSRSAAYPAQLEEDLEAIWKGAEVEVENAGVGGETADRTVQRLEAELSVERPDLVIWQVGTNDAIRGGSEENFRTLLQRGIAAARQAGVDLVLVDQQFYPAIKDPERYERFVGAVRETGREQRVPVFSRYALMKAWAREGPATFRAMLSSDGFHMSDRGYDCLALALGQGIDSMARRTDLPLRPAAALSTRSVR